MNPNAHRMPRVAPRSWNPYALAETGCYAAFVAVLVKISITGEYLMYVTPKLRMPLFAFVGLMFVWTLVCAANVASPTYRPRLGRCLIVLVPALFIIVPVAQSPSDMINPLTQGTSGIAGSASFGQDGLAVATAAASGDDAGTADIPGIDAAARSITITDDTYYRWVNELSAHPDNYDGYKVKVTGFVYHNASSSSVAGSTDGVNSAGGPDSATSTGAFALARLAMWCCPADTYPMGLIVERSDSADTSSFAQDQWIEVRGVLHATGGGISVTPSAIDHVDTPGVEYVFPS